MYKLLLIILVLFSIPNHSISLTYNRDKEDAVRGVLGRYFPDKVTFLNQQTIIQLKLHDVGEFCVNEMVFFSIYGDRISGVVMLFNNSGKMVSEYCSRVVGVWWGYVFIPRRYTINDIVLEYRSRLVIVTSEFDI